MGERFLHMLKPRGLKTDEEGGLVDRAALESNSCRIGVSFVAAYLGSALLLLAGSRSGFVVFLALSQVFAVGAVWRRFRKVEGGTVARPYERERLREIVAASVGAQRSLAVARPTPLRSRSAGRTIEAPINPGPLVSFGLARRATQSVVAFFAAESDAHAASQRYGGDDVELVRIDWASGEVEYRPLH